MPPLPKTRSKVYQYVFSGLHEAAPAEIPNLRKSQQMLSRRDRRREARREARREDFHRKRLEAQRQLRLQPSCLELLPPPKAMDAAALGRAANAAAREPAGASPAFWAALTARAWEILPTLDTQDLALFLNGMARSRHFDRDLLDALREHALERVAYFNARHLAMVFGALARARVPASDVAPLLPELRVRVPECQGAGELTMAISALGRLRLAEGDLVAKLAAQIERRLSADDFHARDLASVSAAYVRLEFLDAQHMTRLTSHARFSLHQATPRELGRLVLGAVRARAEGAGELVSLSAPLAAGMTKFMSPAELADTAFAFGHALEAGLNDVQAGEDAPVPQLLAAVVRETVRAADTFEVWQLVGVLHSCARWQLPLSLSDIKRVSLALQPHCEQLSPAYAGQTLYTFARLLSPQFQAVDNAVSAYHDDFSEAMAAAHCLAEPLSIAICSGLEAGDEAFAGPRALSHALEAAFTFHGHPGTDKAWLKMAPALSARLAREPAIDIDTARRLHDTLLGLGGSPSDPVLRVLAEHSRTDTQQF